MVKITTRHQFELLVRQMELNPSLAHGVRAFGESKASIEGVWNEITDKLNNCGPPFRTAEEWHRVWIHFKAKLKRKIAQNSKNVNTTGGGTSQAIRLSSLEQTAADLLQMGLSGNPQVVTFGADSGETLDDPLVTARLDPTEIQQNSMHYDPQSQQEDSAQPLRVEQTSYERLLEQDTDSQNELLLTMQRIEKTLKKKNEILKDIRDIARKKMQVVNDIYEIKRKKYEFFLEERELRKEICQTKLEILKKKLSSLNDLGS